MGLVITWVPEFLSYTHSEKNSALCLGSTYELFFAITPKVWRIVEE
jgi:hypothetical protein